MADLPVDHLTPDLPPFTSVGIDCFAQFQVRCGWSFVKTYGVITCMAIRAVPTEVAYSLDTDSFLTALTRFIARRVKWKKSDQTTERISQEMRESFANRSVPGITQKSVKLYCKRVSSGSLVPRMGPTTKKFKKSCIRNIQKYFLPCFKRKLPTPRAWLLYLWGWEYYEWAPKHDGLKRL